MERISLTPFGRRPRSSVSIASDNNGQIPHQKSTKWQILRDATTARKALDVSDRDLAVLSALLSFYPEDDLDGTAPLIVFPSNRTLAERAHGMAESTLRRHLAALVSAGMIQRHDSPNGKRYARRQRDGVITLAFGFDLTPLAHRAREIADLADQARAKDHRCKLLREKCVLRIRDLKAVLTDKATDDGAQDRLQGLERHLRRKLDEQALEDVLSACETLLKTSLPTDTTDKPSGNDSQNERHKEDQFTDYFDSDSPTETVVTLERVLHSCHEVQQFTGTDIKNWHDFIRCIDRIRPSIDIGDLLWTKACTTMGACEAAVTIACLLERFTEIRSPGGCFRHLTNQAEKGLYSIEKILEHQDARKHRSAA